jgi:hypothetical protein
MENPIKFGDYDKNQCYFGMRSNMKNLLKNREFIRMLCDTYIFEEGNYLFMDKIGFVRDALSNYLLYRGLLIKIMTSLHKELTKIALKSSYLKKNLGTNAKMRSEMFKELKHTNINRDVLNRHHNQLERYYVAYICANWEEFIMEYIKHMTYHLVEELSYTIHNEVMIYHNELKIIKKSKEIAINKIKRNSIYNLGLGLKISQKQYSKDFN